MVAFRFNALLLEVGIAAGDVRLLRHETRRHARTPYALWRDDPDGFNDYQRVQSRARRNWFSGPYWASFVVTPEGKTLFVGLYRVALAGSVPDDWIDPISLRNAIELAEYELYDATLVEPLLELRGRLVIDWGIGTRTWAQRAAAQDKRIIELRERIIDPEFPGYAAFIEPLSEIANLPPAWRSALSAVGGIYLLTCPETREQYVGAATGSGGFLARWGDYARDGHGGNIRLKTRPLADYRVSILQVAGTADTTADVLAMESLWKRKLQSREMGLNSN